MEGTRVASTGVDHGVGLTALMVAAARAIDTHRPTALAHDPYAEHFVRAAHPATTWPLRIEDVPGGDSHPLWGRLGGYFALRTRTLDDLLLTTTGRGIRQVVLLGAGLDARAYRLTWPPGCVVYEVDRPGVLDFKDEVLATLSATPTSDRRAIRTDFRENWVQALADAGFDSAAPTIWVAEGLLLYLPREAEERLMASIDLLSVSGSHLAFEVKTGVESAEVRHSPVYTATLHEIGVDLLALFDKDPRPNSPAMLHSYGWDVTTRTPFDFTRRYGRGPLPVAVDSLATNRWILAVKQ